MISLDFLTELLELLAQNRTAALRCTQLLFEAKTLVDNGLLALLRCFNVIL